MPKSTTIVMIKPIHDQHHTNSRNHSLEAEKRMLHNNGTKRLNKQK